MREILFRGKRIDNGEWAYGGYRKEKIGEYPVAVFIIEHLTSGVYENHRVDCKTVGQYTGLTSNGKEIFEGDILSIAQIMDGIGGYNFPPLKYPVNVVVIWDKCAWSWKTICKDKRYIHFPDAWCRFECEVIGNIHDNPELLKGGEG